MPHSAAAVRALLMPFHVQDWTQDNATTIAHVSGVRVHAVVRKRHLGKRTWSLSAGQGMVGFIPVYSASVITDLNAVFSPEVQCASLRGHVRWAARMIRAGVAGGPWFGHCGQATQVVFQNLEHPVVKLRYTPTLRNDAVAMMQAMDLDHPYEHWEGGFMLHVPRTQHERLEMLARAELLRRGLPAPV